MEKPGIARGMPGNRTGLQCGALHGSSAFTSPLPKLALHCGIMSFARILLSLFLSIITLAPLARAEVSPISIRVEQAGDSDNGKFKKTQTKTLKIHITNSSAQDRTALRVKYWFFGKDVKDRDLAVLKQGEAKTDIKARATEMVESARVETVAVEAHTDKGKKKVGASGDKFAGYGVQVLEGDKLMAEFFSSPSLKASAKSAVK